MARSILIWGILGIVILTPIFAAAMSPLLAWRDGAYIFAGFAGIAALGLLLAQPLLAAHYLPGLKPATGRKLHQSIGIGLVTLVIAHVGGLWITSPPDVVDALLFRSPTPFSVWGVVAMCGLFLSATLVALRKRIRIPVRTWKRLHKSLAMVVVITTIVHAILVDGTMEIVSKYLLCSFVLITAVSVILLKGVFFRRT